MSGTPNTSLMYPAQPPVVVGPHKITVDSLLKAPTQITRRLANLTQGQFLGDYLFSKLGERVVSGAIVYNQAQIAALYASRDVLELAPGDEFPLVNVGEGPQLTIVTRRFGGAFDVTDVAKNRNAWNIVDGGLVKLANTMIRKAEALCIAALAASPVPIPTTNITTPWDVTGGDPLGDMPKIIGAIDDQDEGYSSDTLLLNPQMIRILQGRKDIREALPRENTAYAAVFNKTLSGLNGLRFASSNRLAIGEGYLLASQQVGTIGEEEPLSSEVVPIRLEQKTRVQSWRAFVPFVTDPLAARHLTGLATP